MKKIIVLLLVFSLVFSMILALGACKPKPTPDSGDTPNDQPSSGDQPSGDDPTDTPEDPEQSIGDPSNSGTGIELPPIEVESTNNQTNQDSDSESDAE